MRKYHILYFLDFLMILSFVYLVLQLKFGGRADTESQLVYFKYVVPKTTVSNNSYGNAFEAPRILKTISHKKLITVVLNDHPSEIIKRLDFIRLEARRLKYTNDTNTVIKVFIPDSSKYGTFLSLLQMVNEDGHKRYFEYQNFFYIFGEAPETSKRIESLDDVKPIYL
jgi:hypothetical protein